MTLEDTIDRLKTRSIYTPDFVDLSQYTTHLVLVHGRLKVDDPSSALYMNGAKYLGRGLTVEDRYVMRRVKANLPIVLERRDMATSCHILGDVFAVDTETFIRLDLFESNQNLTTRKKVYTQFVDQNVPVKNNRVINPVVETWMYIGMDTVWRANEFSYPFASRRVLGGTIQRSAFEFDFRESIVT